MISDGRGMHADSIAIKRTTPEYPSADIVATMKLESISIILAITSAPIAMTIQEGQP
jgi:hypothetical protein